MKFVAISKFLLILALPFLIFLLVMDFVGFDTSFYEKKFLEYKVHQEIPEASSLNEKIIDFIKGKNSELPSEFNEREKQHLWDVRRVVRISTIVLYIFIALFILLLIASAFILKANNYIINFVGKVLVLGGILTAILAMVLFFLINSDFSAAFESFHLLLFEKGTYVFDPAKEMIVKLYPEQIFTDLGINISKVVILASAILILLGALLVLKSKKNK